MRLSVIVPFHRRVDQLSQCLRALRTASNQLRSECEIIVAADGSTEDVALVVETSRALLVALPRSGGPAIARNRAATQASGDALVFVDSDVLVHPDALVRLERALEEDPGIDAVFGAYDDNPGDSGLVSQAKNLAHAFVHRHARRQAVTFWAGLGAVRTGAFRRVGGFDERFVRPSVEDIDLGYRLVAQGSSITLEPAIRGTHLKRWSARDAFVSDLRDRGIPWIQLVYRYGQLRNDLNLAHRYRACAALSYVVIGGLLLSWTLPWTLMVVPWALCAMWVLDFDYLSFVARSRGWRFAGRAFPLRVVHHWTSGASFVIGTALYLARRGLGVSLAGALPFDAWTATSAWRSGPPAGSR